jgi:hypothetical protein
MNKALVLIEALESIITRVNSQSSPYDTAYEETLTDVLSLAENAVNIVGGREEIDFLYEDLRCKTIDLDVALNHFKDYTPYGSLDVTSQDIKRLIDTIIPVLTAVDDLTGLGVSGA